MKNEELTEKSVSPQCAAGMHPACIDWDGCGCLECHKICENPQCRRQCRSLYLQEDGTGVCATCSREHSDPITKTSPCESCGHHRAYRHPGTGDDRFLCPSCHEEAGHLRHQVPHGAVEDERRCSWCLKGHCGKCQEMTKLAGGSACRCLHGQEPARSPAEIEEATRDAPCPQCWAYPHGECGVAAGGQKQSLHYKRYERAARKGVITDAELAQAKKHVRDSYVVWEEEGTAT
jgi:hypothetical protein